MEDKINQLTLLLRIIRHLHREISGKSFHEMGLSHGQPKILGILRDHNGCIQREISDRCHIKPSTVTNILMNMERDGLIRRAANERDARVYNIYTTSKGQGMQERIKEIHQQVDERCFEGFSEIEREQTIEYLGRILENLEREKNHVSIN